MRYFSINSKRKQKPLTICKRVEEIFCLKGLVMMKKVRRPEQSETKP